MRVTKSRSLRQILKHQTKFGVLIFKCASDILLSKRIIMKNRIGFDIGGVILERPPLHVLFAVQRGASDADVIKYWALPVRSVTESIRGIAKRFNPENIFLISKASDRLADVTMHILRSRRFFSFTGIPEENVRFVHTIQEKARQCIDCGVGHFVDDNPRVLALLGKEAPDTHLILFQSEKTNQNLKHDFIFSHYSIVPESRYLFPAIMHNILYSR